MEAIWVHWSEKLNSACIPLLVVVVAFWMVRFLASKNSTSWFVMSLIVKIIWLNIKGVGQKGSPWSGLTPETVGFGGVWALVVLKRHNRKKSKKVNTRVAVCCLLFAVC